MTPTITDPVLLALEREKIKIRAEIDNLNKTKNEAFRENSVAIQKLKTMREELTVEVDALAERRSLLQQEIADSGSAVTSYKESALKELDRELETKRKSIAQLHARLSQEEHALQQEKKTYQEKIEQLEQSRIILEARTKRVEEREKNVKLHDEQLSSLVSTATNAVKTAEHKKAQLDAENERLLKSVEELKQTTLLFNAEFQAKKKELQEMKLSIRLQQEKISDTLEEQKQKETDLRNREALLKDRQEVLKANIKELRSKGVKI